MPKEEKLTEQDKRLKVLTVKFCNARLDASWLISSLYLHNCASHKLFAFHRKQRCLSNLGLLAWWKREELNIARASPKPVSLHHSLNSVPVQHQQSLPASRTSPSAQSKATRASPLLSSQTTEQGHSSSRHPSRGQDSWDSWCWLPATLGQNSLFHSSMFRICPCLTTQAAFRGIWSWIHISGMWAGWSLWLQWKKLKGNVHRAYSLYFGISWAHVP